MGALSIVDIRLILTSALRSRAWKSSQQTSIHAALSTKEISVQLLELSGVPRFVEFAYEALCMPEVRRAFLSQASGWQVDIANAVRAHINDRVGFDEASTLCSAHSLVPSSHVHMGLHQNKLMRVPVAADNISVLQCIDTAGW